MENQDPSGIENAHSSPTGSVRRESDVLRARSINSGENNQRRPSRDEVEEVGGNRTDQVVRDSPPGTPEEHVESSKIEKWESNLPSGYKVFKTTQGGSISDVHFARDLCSSDSGDSVVALKCPSREAWVQYKRRGLKDIFEREARVLEILSHANIVKLKEYDAPWAIPSSTLRLYILAMDYNTSTTCFLNNKSEAMTKKMEEEEFVLVLEYCRQNLEIFLLNERPALHLVRRIFREVLLALQACHDADVVHCDLNPRNVLLTEGLTVRLADFGVSRYTDESATLETTPAIRPPEYVKDPSVAPHASFDMYGAGFCLLSLLLTDVPDSVPEGVEDLKNASKLKNGGMNAAAVDLVEKLIKDDPEERLTATQALQHPFLASKKRKDPCALDSTNFQDLSTPIAQRKRKRLCARKQ